MNENELDENGNNSPSGTGAFVESLSGDESRCWLNRPIRRWVLFSLHGCGESGRNYKKGEQDAWRWSSDGLGEYTVEKASKEDRDRA